MSVEAGGVRSLPDILTILADKFPQNRVFVFMHRWENVTYALVIAAVIFILACLSARKLSLIPGRLQAAAEMIVSGLDDFICGVVGPKGRKYTPFVGTLFIYIVFMNLAGFVPFIKSSTADLSTTLGLALCVFFYVQYTALRELGLLGYIDHLAGKPRGILAATVVFPVFMFFLHILTELVRPLSLSLRLRGNIWGDEMLITVVSGFGLHGLPLLFFNLLVCILAAFIQAVVFCLLTTIYLAFVTEQEEETAQGFN